MFYPKLYNLFERELFDLKKDKKNRRKCIEDKFFYPEFSNVNWFRIDEKIDGTNIRIEYNEKVSIGGRTVNSQIPKGLLEFLNNKFGGDLLHEFFKRDDGKPNPKVVLFGEGVGPKIQGNPYGSDFDFVLFDINIDGHWLDKDDVRQIGNLLDITLAPDLGTFNKEQLVEFVKSKPKTRFGKCDIIMEGVVARSEPQLYSKHGDRVLFKLRCIDFE